MPDKGLAYNLELTKRQPLTDQNLKELGINESILDHPNLAYTDANGVGFKPIGLSINDARFGDFPEKSAAARGWITYMNLGEPLIEERSNIEQPAPDTLSSRTYVNRDQTSKRTFQDGVDFAIANQISWSIQGTVQLTFGARTNAQLQTFMQKRTSTRYNQRQSYKQASTDVTTEVGYTEQGTATGTAELHAQLILGITASVSGSLTTTWTSRSTVSGDIQPNSRVETIARQRRVLKQYAYEIPVTFAGFFAVRYEVPADILSPPQAPTYPALADVVARSVHDVELVEGGKFRQKGTAETVSVLAVEHTVFDAENLTYDERELYKK